MTEDQAASAPNAQPSEKPKRILIAEDNEAAAKMLKLYVERLGHDVRIAHNGVDAVKEASAFRPDLILMDLGMPDMNGYDAARKIREEPWGAETILVALTGRGSKTDKANTKKAGFDHHLVKPPEPSDLLCLLGKANP